MIISRRRRRKGALCLLFLLALGAASRAASSFTTSDNFIVNSFGLYCESSTEYTLDAFESTFYGVRPVVVEGAYLIATYPAHWMAPKRYRVEGARGTGIQTCTICPYDEFVAADGLNKMAYGLGGLPYEASPMYGPCLDLSRSVKTACVQNTLFYPPSFVGEYFYPDQSLFAPVYVGGTNAALFAQHAYLQGATLLTPTAPTLFGLGKTRVKQLIASIRIMDKNTLAVDELLTAEFTRVYTTVSPEGWLLWAQHQCNPGCHRNAEYQQVAVRTLDWQGQSAVLQHLNRQDTNGVQLDKLTRCHLCPPYHAAYNWNPGLDAPLSPNLEWNAIAQTCFPWFGAIPIFNSMDYYNLQIDRTEAHSSVGDGVLKPSVSSTYYASTPCASGYYNDVCGHTLRHYKQVAMNPSTPAAEAAAAALNAQCKPCPAGYHTDGQTGAWFCLPPPGLIFSEGGRGSLLAHVEGNQSIAWSRRNRIGYEFECGYKLEHCKQCALLGMSAMLPDEFNKLMILNVILQTMPCPQGFYCTHSFRTEPIACPADKPWSPAGSFSLSNCTCARGTFLNASDQCAPCLAINSCPTGEYLSGWTDCSWKNGMTSPGVCTRCTNVPPANAILMPGGGIEWSYPDRNETVVGGACPFQCATGYELVPYGNTNPPTDCAVVWQCEAVPPYKNKVCSPLSNKHTHTPFG